MSPVTVVTNALSTAPPQAAYDAVVPVELAAVFTGMGPVIPAVTGTEDGPARWGYEPGSRRVLLAGGGVMDESTRALDPPHRFAYRVTPAAGPLKLLISHIDGEFLFDAAPTGGSRITWTYAFEPARGRSPLVLAFRPLWARYARRVLDDLAAIADRAS